MKLPLAKRMFITCITAFTACSPASERLEPVPEYTNTAGGEKALVVDIVPDEARWGSAALWSRGAFVRKRDGNRERVIHVGVRVSNTTNRELSADLPASRVSIKENNGDVVDDIAPIEADRLTVRPHGEATADVFFPLPPDSSPQDVLSFEFTWSVANGNATVHERAGFSEQRPKYVYVDDPFWRPYGFYGPGRIYPNRWYGW